MRVLADENFRCRPCRHCGRWATMCSGREPTLPALGDAALLDVAEAPAAGSKRRHLFRVHPTIAENVTPLVLRTMGTDREGTGHASVVTVDRVPMLRSKQPDTR